jgi:hypothetical protein
VVLLNTRINQNTAVFLRQELVKSSFEFSCLSKLISKQYLCILLIGHGTSQTARNDAGNMAILEDK